MKHELIHTKDYLVVTDSGVKAGDYVVTYPDRNVVRVDESSAELYDDRIIAFLPITTSALHLDGLPLLPPLEWDSAILLGFEVFYDIDSLDNDGKVYPLTTTNHLGQKVLTGKYIEA